MLWSVGEWLDVLDTSNEWCVASIRAKKDSLLLIHYRGWHSKYDEWLHRENGRLAPLFSRTIHDDFWDGEIEASKSDLVDARDSRGTWLSALVVEKTTTAWYIHYTEWSPKYDEWIPYYAKSVAPRHTFVKTEAFYLKPYNKQLTYIPFWWFFNYDYRMALNRTNLGLKHLQCVLTNCAEGFSEESLMELYQRHRRTQVAFQIEAAFFVSLGPFTRLLFGKRFLEIEEACIHTWHTLRLPENVIGLLSLWIGYLEEFQPPKTYFLIQHKRDPSRIECVKDVLGIKGTEFNIAAYQD